MVQHLSPAVSHSLSTFGQPSFADKATEKENLPIAIPKIARLDQRRPIGQPGQKFSGRASLLAAPKIPLQIAQSSLLSPQRLSEIAAAYEERQMRAANEQYQAFHNTGYPNFIQWVESLIEKSATVGGRFLLLTFDNSTGIVTAATTGPKQILPPASYALPIAQSPLQRLAEATADHFRKADFRVQKSRLNSTDTRLGAPLTPAYDCVDILWGEAGCSEPFATEETTYTMFPIRPKAAGPAAL